MIWLAVVMMAAVVMTMAMRMGADSPSLKKAAIRIRKER